MHEDIKIGCIMSVFSQNFNFLLASRVIQACGAGILMPLLQVVALYLFPSDQQGKAMGLVGIVVGFAPAIGPTLSGVMTDLWGWILLIYAWYYCR